MGITFNPFSGLPDFTGSAAPAPAPSNYVQTFATGAFVLVGSDYTLTIPAATHGLGVSPGVEVFELVGSDYQSIITLVSINPSGDVTILVNQTPDNRFNGKVVIF